MNLGGHCAGAIYPSKWIANFEGGVRLAMRDHAMTEIPCPPPLELFEPIVTNAALVESVRAIWRNALFYAERDPSWIPHLEFVEAFMREHGVSFYKV